MRGKFTICSIKFHVNFFQWCRIMRLEYVIKCRLSTRKWHVMGRSLMWQNGIWLVEYISSKWTIASCSCSAMIGYVVIGLWMMFSEYVMEFKLFGVCIVRKGAEKTRFIRKNYTIKINANLSYSEKFRPHSKRLLKGTIIKLFKWAQDFWLMSFFVRSPLIPWHHLHENNTQTLWLVHDMQTLWYDWCDIHTLMRQSDRCEIHTLMRRSDWCEQHTTLHANKITQKEGKKQYKNMKRKWVICTQPE